MGGVFDFPKNQIPTKSPSKPGRRVVGLDIDRCIISDVLCGMPTFLWLAMISLLT